MMLPITDNADHLLSMNKSGHNTQYYQSSAMLPLHVEKSVSSTKAKGKRMCPIVSLL